MPKYNVHILREMRLYFPNVEADNPEAAAKLASETDTCEADEAEDCNGEDFGAVVDIVGDEDFSQSQMIDFEPERMRKGSPKLLASLREVLPYAIAEAESLESHRRDDPTIAQEADNAWDAVEEAGNVLGEIIGKAD